MFFICLPYLDSFYDQIIARLSFQAAYNQSFYCSVISGSQLSRDRYRYFSEACHFFNILSYSNINCVLHTAKRFAKALQIESEF